MKDSKRALRTAYYNALSGHVTLNSLTVPAMDRVPADQPAPYIFLSTQTQVPADRGKKECRLQESTILLDIVTAYDGSKGGKHEVDLIAEQLFPLLTPEDSSDLPSLGTDFRIVAATVDSDIDLEEQLTPTRLLIRRLIRFRNTIEEL